MEIRELSLYKLLNIHARGISWCSAVSKEIWGVFFKRSDHFIHSWLTSPFHLDINVLAKLSNFVEQWVIVGLQFANGVIALLFVDDLIAYAL